MNTGQWTVLGIMLMIAFMQLFWGSLKVDIAEAIAGNYSSNAIYGPLLLIVAFLLLLWLASGAESIAIAIAILLLLMTVVQYYPQIQAFSGVTNG